MAINHLFSLEQFFGAAGSVALFAAIRLENGGLFPVDILLTSLTSAIVLSILSAYLKENSRNSNHFKLLISHFDLNIASGTILAALIERCRGILASLIYVRVSKSLSLVNGIALISALGVVFYAPVFIFDINSHFLFFFLCSGIMFTKLGTSINRDSFISKSPNALEAASTVGSLQYTLAFVSPLFLEFMYQQRLMSHLVIVCSITALSVVSIFAVSEAKRKIQWT